MKRRVLNAVVLAMAAVAAPSGVWAYTFAGTDWLFSGYGITHITGLVTQNNPFASVADPTTANQTSTTSISMTLVFDPYLNTTVPGTGGAGSGQRTGQAS